MCIHFLLTRLHSYQSFPFDVAPFQTKQNRNKKRATSRAESLVAKY